MPRAGTGLPAVCLLAAVATAVRPPVAVLPVAAATAVPPVAAAMADLPADLPAAAATVVLPVAVPLATVVLPVAADLLASAGRLLVDMAHLPASDLPAAVSRLLAAP
jgi:hypothetical protein